MNMICALMHEAKRGVTSQMIGKILPPYGIILP